MILPIITFIPQSFAQKDSAITFYKAKKLLINEYRKNMKDQNTFYCNAPIKWQGKKGVPNLKVAGYKVRKQPERAGRVEWEQVMPANVMAATSSCWENGGYENCSQKDEIFKKAEGDMHNIYPVIGEVHSDRSNYKAESWDGDLGSYYGKCTAKVDFKKQLFDPSEYAKGAVARAYLYMSQTYNIPLSKDQSQLYETWNEKYKAAPWECKRHSHIAKLIGKENPFIAKQCQ